jgi:Mn2+/Fe2+ NRAMP family transporter
MAAAAGENAAHVPPHDVGQIADALYALRGGLCMGVLGAAMVAALVSSLALAWGLGEIAGQRRPLASHPFEARWFYGVYAAAVIGSAVFVARVPDLLSLNIAAQVLNALLLPLVAGWLIARRAALSCPLQSACAAHIAWR